MIVLEICSTVANRDDVFECSLRDQVKMSTRFRETELSMPCPTKIERYRCNDDTSNFPHRHVAPANI